MRDKQAWLIPLPALIVIVLLVAFSLLNRTIAVTDDGQYLYISCIELLAVALPAAFFCKLRGVGYLSELNIRFIDPSGALLSVICALIMVMASACMRVLLISFGIGSTALSLYGFFLPDASSDIASGLYSVVVYALLPSLIEEFFFRSVLMREYKRAGALTAVIVPTVLFALTSLSVSGFMTRLLCGLILATLVFVTKSVLAAVIAHFLFAVYELFLQPYILEFASKPDNRIFLFFLLGAVLLLLLVLAFGEAERLFYRRAVNNEPYTSVRGSFGKLLRCLLSPVFLLSCGVFLIYILLLR